MPLILRETKTVNGRQTTRPAIDNPLYPILKDCPNEWQTSYQIRWFLVSQLVMQGNCFCQKITDQSGEIISLNPLDAWNMAPHWDRTVNPPALLWRHTDGLGQVREFKQSDLWHVTNTNIEGNGVAGTAIIALAKEALSVLMAAEETAGRNFANGLGMGGFISFPAEYGLDEPEAQNVVDTLKKNFSGSQNAGKFTVIPGGGKWEKMTFNAQESQLLESRKWNEQEVVRLLGGAPLLVKLGLGEQNSTYASSAAFLDEYFNTSLLPLTTAIEQSITRDLIDKPDRGSCSQSIVRTSSFAAHPRTERRQIRFVFQSFQMTPNEARAIEDLDSIEGGDFLSGGTGTPVIFDIEKQEFFIPGQLPPASAGTANVPDDEEESGADTAGTEEGNTAPPVPPAKVVPAKPDKSKARLQALALSAIERIERKAAKSDLDAKFVADVLACSMDEAQTYCETYKNLTPEAQRIALVKLAQGE